MRAGIALGVVASLILAGCTASKPQTATDLMIALDVAATAEGAYAARPDADPKKVTQVGRLLATAQAAVAAWSASSRPADQALASAAIAALVEYEGSAVPGP
jgi:hypothetical protein